LAEEALVAVERMERVEYLEDMERREEIDISSVSRAGALAFPLAMRLERETLPLEVMED
jgi:hypothetical protein